MKISRILKQNSQVPGPAPFHIHSIQTLLERNKEGDAPLFFDDMYLIIWIIKGVVEISIDTNKLLINENVALYVKPGQLFSMGVDEDARGYAISFAKDFVDLTEITLAGLFHPSHFNRNDFIPLIHIWGDAITSMVSFADNMIQEFNSVLDLRSDILKGYLKIFLIYLCRQLQQERQGNYWSRRSNLVNLFLARLEKHYASKKMVKEYAEILGVSPSYLNGVVKNLSGHTASHHIQQRIVLEAKRRVLHEGYTLKETAYDLGFGDPAHFSKYFKNCSGINYTNFKKGFSM
ncbi:MAG TPA: helix-turn-helix domain-containing protein [Niastella sp.]